MVRHTLLFVFDCANRHVLLEELGHGPNAGLLNGIGGRMLPEDKTPGYAALRELREKAGICPDGLEDFRPLMVTTSPCGAELHVYYGVLRPGCDVSCRAKTPLHWVATNETTNAADSRFAGRGNLSYFVQAALGDLCDMGRCSGQ